MKRMLREVRRRGDIAIVFDKVGDFTAEFHDESRGDVLLNPLDARSPDWSPWAEMRDIADAYRMAKSLIPSVEGANNFFHSGAQDLFATLLTRIWRMPDRSLLGLLTCALVMDRKDKAKLLARTAAAKHYEGDHRSGQDVDATMSVYTQALRFLPQTAGGAQDFSIRDFIADAVTRREQAPEAALTAIRARFRAEIAELQKARSLLASGELRAAFRLIARVTIAYPLLPDGMVAPVGLVPGRGDRAVEAMFARGIIVDVAHMSAAAVNATLDLWERHREGGDDPPRLVMSHGGVRQPGCLWNDRNLDDDTVTRLMLAGVPFGIIQWDRALCARGSGVQVLDARIDGAYAHALSLAEAAGEPEAALRTLALGIDLDGAVRVPRDVRGVPLTLSRLAESTWCQNLGPTACDATLRDIAGRNAVRFLRAALPETAIAPKAQP